MGLNTNTQLGPYLIVAPLGAGGMGEVYRARDSRLDRDVAIKVPPDSMARDKERTRALNAGIRSGTPPGDLNQPPPSPSIED